MHTLLGIIAYAVLLCCFYIVQMRYARAGYPHSVHWRAALFAIGAAIGVASGIWVSVGGRLPPKDAFLVVGLLAAVVGIISSLLYPIGMQFLIPRPRSTQEARREVQNEQQS